MNDGEGYDDDESQMMSKMLDNLEGNSDDYEDNNTEPNDLLHAYFGKLVSRASETAAQHNEKKELREGLLKRAINLHKQHIRREFNSENLEHYVLS